MESPGEIRAEIDKTVTPFGGGNAHQHDVGWQRACS